MKKQILSGLIAVAVSQAAWSEDLIQAYQKALNYDSSLSAARYSYEASQAAIDVAKAGLLPHISAYGNAGYTDVDAGSRGDSYKSAGYGLQLSQPLFEADTYFNFEASQFTSNAAKAQFNLAQQQLMLDVSTAYFNVLRAKDTLTTARATEAALKRQWEQAKEQYDVGLIAITGVHEARAGYDSSISQRIAGENQLDVARERLARLTGDYPKQLANLEQNFPVAPPVPQNPDAWEQTALSQNWSIRSAEAQTQATQKQVDIAKAGHYPTVDLTASYGRSNTWGRSLAGGSAGGTTFAASADGWTNTATLGLQLNVPLYAGGGINAGIRQARATYSQSEEQLKTARRNVSLDTRSLFRTINTNIQTVAAQRQAIVSRRSALEATRAGYSVGTRNIVEVLDAEQNYYISLQDYANARYDYVINTLSLKQAAGTLSPEDLLELNKWLSASAPGIGALAKEPGSDSSGAGNSGNGAAGNGSTAQ